VKPFPFLGLSTTSVSSSERPACRSRVCGFGPERPPSAKTRAGVGAASITSGAPSRSWMSAGCTFMVIGDNSTPVTARRLRPWPSCSRHSPAGRRSPWFRRPPLPPASSARRRASSRAAGAGSAHSSAYCRTASLGAGDGRPIRARIPAEAPVTGTPWREHAGRHPPLPADLRKAGGPFAPARAISARRSLAPRRRLCAGVRPASRKGGGFRCPKARRLPFAAAPA